MTNKMINLTPDISTIISTVAKPKALVVFAHGAGADKSHEFMEQVSLALNQKNINVLRFNFSYMDVRLAQGNRRPPDRMPKLLECFSTVIDGLDSDLPLFIAGKSMGGRVAATLAGDKTAKFLGVMCLGYPFHPQKKPEKLRLAPLQETQMPILILQGTRDALGSQEEIAQYEFSERCHCIFFTDGDHNLKPRVKSGFTHAQHIQSAVNEMVKFIDEHNPDEI
ncbi:MULTISPECIES: alpha/beta family hydrolase [unclassified Colwellia]|jgi:predicted alpha/beta-hydrolase family hydrolase|uniref:alpha/beta family hydrolase n=1 Tax=unclassified Colwellia TaxID=196834 RepID=UPI0015F58B47|nr:MULTISPECIES: alpha/beta family hydrolase [unclassified Colwellia]MBA6348779.1 alpha/beta hydrolase [Colwellia sp. BRX8-9]MBA6357351.1 alpha/beta hydrolase [Colwellia sp. BRX8-3]MBA6359571.1 alpha/beta hydrolase [Colwellia sp. BRX8-6]MBA6367452.1 alpha/beta hydrolase [Colwellia sp. BRX8-5]MBA6373789.1 alpha/beta hydrolase [Colwellia sp. BRX8-2]